MDHLRRKAKAFADQAVERQVLHDQYRNTRLYLGPDPGDRHGLTQVRYDYMMKKATGDVSNQLIPLPTEESNVTNTSNGTNGTGPEYERAMRHLGNATAPLTHTEKMMLKWKRNQSAPPFNPDFPEGPTDAFKQQFKSDWMGDDGSFEPPYNQSDFGPYANFTLNATANGTFDPYTVQYGDLTTMQDVGLLNTLRQNETNDRRITKRSLRRAQEKRYEELKAEQHRRNIAAGFAVNGTKVPSKFLKECATHLLTMGDVEEAVFAPHLTPYCLAMAKAFEAKR
jgi:hypothetical protein